MLVQFFDLGGIQDLVRGGGRWTRERIPVIVILVGPVKGVVHLLGLPQQLGGGDLSVEPKLPEVLAQFPFLKQYNVEHIVIFFDIDLSVQ